MGNYAAVLNGKVDNLVVWDGESAWRPAEGVLLVSAPTNVGLGWGYDPDTNSFTAPPAPPPAPPSSGARKLV
jgi:hypothetical protein